MHQDSPSNAGPAKPVHPITLIMCSGGIDSTYALWRALQAGPVHAHHVCLRFGAPQAAMEPREALERRAFRAVLRELRETHSGLGSSESRIHLPEASRRDGRAAVLVFAAARVAASEGLTGLDRIVFGTNGDVDPGWCPDTAAFALRRLLMLRALRAAMERDDVPRLALADPPPDKARMWSDLPASLRALVVSCTRPVAISSGSPGPDPDPLPCGRCEKCSWRARHAVPGVAVGSGPVLMPEHDVHCAGSAIVARGRAEGEDIRAQPQPAVHLGLENRPGIP